MSVVQSRRPYFSIVLPTRNRAFLVKDLLTSILRQEFKDFEIIVADNSENLETQELIEKFHDERIKNIQTGNLNMADNWEAGVNASVGRYLLLFSDKMILKHGSLDFLNKYTKKYNPECITWTIDAFYDRKNIFKKSLRETENHKISSVELIKNILCADMTSFDRAPFHCNSCISMETIEKIKGRFGRLCMQLNPDYTMAYQVILTVKCIDRLNKSFTVLRYPDLDTSYGNGNSFMKKTEQASDFMADNKDWIVRTNGMKQLPLKDNLFVLDHVLKDLYSTLKLHEVEPDTLISSVERLISYYFGTYKEYILRQGMGVDMSYESFLWKSALSKEDDMVQSEISRRIKPLKMTKWKSVLLFIIKNNYLSLMVLKGYRRIKYKQVGIKYYNIEDYINRNVI